MFGQLKVVYYFQFSTCYCNILYILSVIVSGVIFPWKSASFFIQCGLLGYIAESELPEYRQSCAQ